MGGRGLQKNPECVKKTELKHKTLYCPNEFVHDCRYESRKFLYYLQGNDQVRFEMTYYALYPEVKVGHRDKTD